MIKFIIIKLFIIDVIGIIWPRSPPYNTAANYPSPEQRSSGHPAQPHKTQHLSHSFFRLYNLTSPLTSSSSFLFLHITLRQHPQILCFAFRFCLFCFLSTVCFNLRFHNILASYIDFHFFNLSHLYFRWSYFFSFVLISIEKE